uniref:Reverse transcriptase zinc-binding domain-containing protein n=1 Tax=Fagus sylvatica TaxID=28930 RepID=A0A2N9F9B1_FAGSY
MAGIVKPPGAFAITPHKVSACILLQIYAPSVQISVPFPFSSVAQHNRLGLFLLALTKSCDDILEPKLDELISQLREVCGLSNHRFIDHLTSRLSALSAPDDLFNFFTDMRGILGGPESGVMEDDQVILDPGSTLGMFLRRCILAFNLLSFEIDGQTEFVNKSLGNLLRCLVGETNKNWELILSTIQLAYNSFVGVSPCEVVHGYPPKKPLDQLPMSPHVRVFEFAEAFAQHLHDLHHEIRRKIQARKWLWRYATEPMSLWRRVVASKYGSQWGGWCSNQGRAPHGSLRDSFPVLFRLARNQEAIVADYLHVHGHTHSWDIEFSRSVQDWEVAVVDTFMEPSPLFSWRSVWKAKVPSRVAFFLWTATLGVWWIFSIVGMVAWVGVKLGKSGKQYLTVSCGVSGVSGMLEPLMGRNLLSRL